MSKTLGKGFLRTTCNRELCDFCGTVSFVHDTTILVKRSRQKPPETN